MKTRFMLRAFQIFGTLAMIVGLVFSGAMLALGFPFVAFVFVILAVGGTFVEQYGTTRLIYTEPLSVIIKKARRFQEDEELLTRKVGK